LVYGDGLVVVLEGLLVVIELYLLVALGFCLEGLLAEGYGMDGFLELLCDGCGQGGVVLEGLCEELLGLAELTFPCLGDGFPCGNLDDKIH
jgi:hypothetical protein